MQSMTGYGAVQKRSAQAEIQVDLRTLNSKGFDLSLRLPRACSSYEPRLRQMLSDALHRGKVNYQLTYKPDDALTQTGVVLNEALIKRYYQEAARIARDLEAPAPRLFESILRFPEVFQSAEDAEDTTMPDMPMVEAATLEALEQVQAFRTQEGRRLEEVLRSYQADIRKGLDHVRQQDGERLPAIRRQLRRHLEELAGEGQIDRERLEQELIYYAEKLDIEEEIVRLEHHLNYFEESMQEEQAGKRLNFIAQEMGREINTIGSKANQAEMQRSVVQMKEALDKIKEQVLNVL